MEDNASALTAPLIPLNELKQVCSTCNLRELCITSGIPSTDLEKLDHLVSSRESINRAGKLYEMGDSFHSLFVVRRGFFKTCMTSEDGRDQIIGFQAPGELLGFDGMATDQYSVDAIALEDSEVCVIPYDQLETIARDFSPLQKGVHKVMSREIMRENRSMLLLGTMNANQRVAAFLLNLSERFHNLGYSRTEFILRMTRQEIGSYLGLQIETVSRVFRRLQDEGIISAKGKSVTLLDMNLLRNKLNEE